MKRNREDTHDPYKLCELGKIYRIIHMKALIQNYTRRRGEKRIRVEKLS